LVERLFWMLFHKGPFLGEPLDEEEAAAIEKSGIAPPPDRIWYVDWDDLTPGQRFVFGELGVHDEQRWILACGRHRLLPDQNSTGGLFRDWEELTYHQQHMISKLGFSRESWHHMAEEMHVSRKTWADLNRFEQRTMEKLEHMGEEAWNSRDATLFRTPWTAISPLHKLELRKLGFDAESWKPYQDPQVPQPWTCMSVAALITKASISSLLAAWLAFAIWWGDLLGPLMTEASIYICLFLGLLACLTVAGKEVFCTMKSVRSEVIVKVRKLHLYIQSFWEAMHDVPQLLDDVSKLLKTHKGYLCKSCKCCNCGASCVPWKQ